MPDRSLSDIDKELSEAVKARAGAKQSIRQMSDAVVWNTKKIDELLAERSRSQCPDTPAELIDTPSPAPVVVSKPTIPPSTQPGRQVR